MLSIEVSNRQTAFDPDAERLQQAAEAVLRDAGIADAQLSIAVVDDSTIHALNRQYLGHDEPTDVLSFLLERDGEHLEGEVIVSADTALRAAKEFGWGVHDELLLYVIHGTLHLIGYDDQSDDERAAMRAAECRYLSRFGLDARGEH
jgi:probable rRNA maturation factor